MERWIAKSRKSLACLLAAALVAPAEARVVASLGRVSAPVSVPVGAAGAGRIAAAGGGSIYLRASSVLPSVSGILPSAATSPRRETAAPPAWEAASSSEFQAPRETPSLPAAEGPSEEKRGPGGDAASQAGQASQAAQASRGKFLYAGLRFAKGGVYASFFDGTRSREDFLPLAPGRDVGAAVVSWLKRRAAAQGAKIVGAGLQDAPLGLELPSRLWHSADIVAAPMASRAKTPGGAARSLARRAARGFVLEDGVPVPLVRVKPSGEVEVSRLGSLEDYRRTAPKGDFERVLKEAEAYRGKRIVYFSSTPRGGGVALMRHALMRFYRLLGVDARWYVLEPDEKVFATTKRLIHNVLQDVSAPGERLRAADRRRFEAWSAKNAAKFEKVFRSADVIVIDDYQPSGMIPFIRKANPGVKLLYRSHIHVRSDLIAQSGTPQKEVWDYLWKNIRLADKFVSHPVADFVPGNVPKEMVAFAPAATDVLDGLNKPLTRAQQSDYLARVGDVLGRLGQTPLEAGRGYIVQVARFDPSKGIPVLLEAYRLFRERLGHEGVPKEKTPQLLLSGHGAVDDVQGGEMYRKTLEAVRRDYPDLAGDIKLAALPPGDQLLNAVLRGSLFAAQLSSAEGYEIKVSEAQRMGKVVIGSRVGGIPLQIDDGRTGYLVRSGDAAGAAERMRALWSDEALRRRMGAAARRKRRAITTVDNALRWLRLSRGAELERAASRGPVSPARIIVGPGTFRIGDLNELLTPGFRKKVRSIMNPDARREFIEAHRPNDAIDLRWILEKEIFDARLEKTRDKNERKRIFQEMLDLVEEYKVSLPEVLESRVRDVLPRFAHAVEDRGVYKVYTVERGLEFWSELLRSQDEKERLAGLLLLRTAGRRAEPDYPVRLLWGLASDLGYVTQVLDLDRFSPEELHIARGEARKRGLRQERIGRHLLVGGGNSFFLARAVLRAAQALSDGVLASRFYRVLRYLTTRGVPMIYDEHQGAAAYYNPSGDEMAYVMPSRADLNATAHEGTHARFEKFQERLKRWTQAKGLAVPYEIDGPSYALFGAFGGYMNLLNELNSWRLGESFDGGKSDADILKLLRRAYGRQAGAENVRDFARIWTPARVKGKSVPRLIMERMRAFNRTTEKGLDRLGKAALATGKRIQAHNFMRLASARHPDLKEAPAGVLAVLENLLSHPDAGVAGVARRLLERPGRERETEKDDEEKDAAEIAGEDLPREDRLERFLGLLKEALTEDGGKARGRQERALRVLEDVLDAWKVETIYVGRDLESINGMDRDSTAEKGRDFAEARNRPPGAETAAGSLLLDPSVDRLLAAGMFDRSPGTHRLALANLIRTRTYPEEFPLLHARLLRVITADDSDKNDLWLARMFLVPGMEFFSAHLRWGESVAEAVRTDATPSVDGLEFSGEYYRLALGRALPGPQWGKWSRPLDEAMLAEAGKARAEFSDAQQKQYRTAVAHLWEMLVHPESKVRLSARFALAGYPGYLLELAERLRASLKADAPLRRGEVRELIDMLEPDARRVLLGADAAQK